MHATSSLLAIISTLAWPSALASTTRVSCNQPFDLTRTSPPSYCNRADITSPPSSSPLAARAGCSNALQNPSFESGILDPWTSSATGSWASRQVLEAPSHHGSFFFHGLSNSTNTSTITLSQANVNIPAGTAVECSAWLYAGGDMGEKGSVRFDVFLDGTSCGDAEVKAEEGGTWRKVGQRLVVQGDVHGIAIVIMAIGMGEVGKRIEIGVDDVKAGWC